MDLAINPDNDIDNDPNLASVCMGRSWWCSFFASRAYFIRHPENHEGVMTRFCPLFSNIGSRDDAGTCEQGAGSFISTYNRDDAVPIEEACLFATSKSSQKRCFMGGMRYLEIVYGGGPLVPEHVCANLTHFKKQCLASTVGN